MNKNIKYLLPFALIAISLASCGNGEKSDGSFSLVCPSGAPTLPLYETIATNSNNGSVKIETTTSNVLNQFDTNNYKYIVFDANQGLTKINNGANYTFLKLLTGGNFHLVRIKSENEMPTNDDYILGFGTENQVPNKVYNKLFPDASFDRSFTDGVSSLLATLKGINADGTIGTDNQEIDWVFIAQPALFNLINSTPNFKALYNKEYDYEVKDLFANKYPQFDYIVQAGLFVNTTYYNDYKEEVDSFLNNVNKEMNNAINNPSTVCNVLDDYSSDLTEQQALFGYNKNIVNGLQSNGQNQFGVVDPNYEFTIDDLVDFNNFLNN